LPCPPPSSASIIWPSLPRIISSVGSAAFSKKCPRHNFGSYTQHYVEQPALSFSSPAASSVISSPRAMTKAPPDDPLPQHHSGNVSLKNQRTRERLNLLFSGGDNRACSASAALSLGHY